jgi:hypothetical protein
MERALSSRRINKGLAQELHRDIIKYYKKYREDEVEAEEIKASIYTKIISEVNKRASSKTTKKVDSFCVDRRYQIYYDTKNGKDFDIDITDPDLQEEVDYLSENEVSHREKDSSSSNLMRQTKKIDQRFKQMNKILTESLTKITKENLKIISN